MGRSFFRVIELPYFNINAAATMKMAATPPVQNIHARYCRLHSNKISGCWIRIRSFSLLKVPMHCQHLKILTKANDKSYRKLRFLINNGCHL